MKKKTTKTITLMSSPKSIVQQFANVFNKGDFINLITKNGFIYAVGHGDGSILCKIEEDKHYSFQRDLNRWVEL